ncbi:hypothetical protein L6452_13800 [Arctium lappa]|uniref:Uncharacterized protein n=1 Tax=Arctium lappa TaxID=4217 RepID=A0ACB9CJ70_ARCLA|nr:hypothetical protein L6452_13800 [Arctium lappa]
MGRIVVGNINAAEKNVAKLGNVVDLDGEGGRFGERELIVDFQHEFFIPAVAFTILQTHHQHSKAQSISSRLFF